MSVLVRINLTHVKKMQDANGLGLQAVGGEDYCRVVIQYPSDTVSKWVSAHVLCHFFPVGGLSHFDCFIWFCTYGALLYVSENLLRRHD